MEQGLEVDAQWLGNGRYAPILEGVPVPFACGDGEGAEGDAFLSAGALDKGGREFHQVFGRNRFSRMSLKCMGPTVGKRVWREVTAAGRGGGLPMVSAVLGAGVGCWLSRCLIIRFSRTSIIFSAGRDAARVEARVLSASAPVAEGGGGVCPSVAVFMLVVVPSVVGTPMVAEDEDEGTPRGVARITVTSSRPSPGTSWFSGRAERVRLPSIAVGPLWIVGTGENGDLDVCGRRKTKGGSGMGENKGRKRKAKGKSAKRRGGSEGGFCRGE